MSKGRVVSVMCRAEFPCKRCGKPFVALTSAPFNEGVIGEPNEPRARMMCTECEAIVEQEAIEQQRRFRKNLRNSSGFRLVGDPLPPDVTGP